jgi:hypothetical protein
MSDELAAVVTPTVEIDGETWRAGDVGIDASGREVKLVRIGKSSWAWVGFGIDTDIPLDMVTRPLAKVHLVKHGEEAAFCATWHAGGF